MRQKATLCTQLVIFAFVLLLALPAPLLAARVTGAAPPEEAAPAEAAKAPPAQKADNETRYEFMFKDAEIEQLIKFMSEKTGKNFIIDRRVKGKISVISPTRLTLGEAWKVFESVLEVYGFTLVESGNVIKVIPAPEARSKDVETLLKAGPRDREDNIITQVIPLAYASPEEIKKVFQPLISKSSIILSYDPTNTLIVTDYQSNIQRLMKILSVIDVMGVGEEIAVIPVENAVATDAVKILTQLFAKKAKPGNRITADEIKLVADERTNSIVAMGTEVDIASVRDLVKMLDREVPRGKGKIRVYYLQNATAEDVAKVIEKLSSGQKTDPTKKGEAPLISKDVIISADKATNSLIITAEQDDYLILEEVIQKLDIPRAMVYIEALIMEVSTTKNFELGVEWRAGEAVTINDGQTAIFGGSGGGGTSGAYQIMPSPTISTAGVSMSYPTGFSLGIIGEPITIGDITFPTIGAVMRAYQNDSDVHILSAPQILTTNNEEAQITVGKNVPYATKQETSTANVDYTTYEYKDVGVILKITPQISQERLVRLDVFQEVTRLIDTGEVDRPTTYKRSAETTVIVQDGSTIVIGGLIDQSTEGGTYKVPCIGDIPGLGYLFKSMYENRERTNLYVFLTPHIVEHPSEAQQIFDKKKEEIKEIEEEAVKLYKRRGDLNMSFDALTIEREEENVLKPPANEAAATDRDMKDDTPAPAANADATGEEQ